MGKNTMCLGCLSHNWPDPKPAVWVHESGVALCEFHVMTSEKRKTLSSKEVLGVEEFNGLVFKRIEDAWQRAKQNGLESMCVLSGVIFPGDIDFSIYDQDAPLPSIDFSGAQFKGSADFSSVTFSGTAEFANSIFDFGARFERSRFRGEATFYKTKFNGIVVLTNTKTDKDISITMLNLDAKSLENLWFSSLEAPCFTFRNCEWPSRLCLERDGNGDSDNLLECNELYQTLKERAASGGDQGQASQWHFREKFVKLKRTLLCATASAERVPMQRTPRFCLASHLMDAVEDSQTTRGMRLEAWMHLFSLLRWPERRSLLFWYWTSNGFGERSGRAAMCLLALAAAALMVLIGLKIGETWPGWQAPWRPDLGKSLEILVEWMRCMPLVKLDYQPAPELPIIGPIRFFLTGLFQVAITIQAALFALAVRNRFRR